MLNAAVAGSPIKTTCSINGTSYSTGMKNTGIKNPKNETIYKGNLGEPSMIKRWGQESPELVTFTFTATHSGGTTRTHSVAVIVDDMNKYWQLHRVL